MNCHSIRHGMHSQAVTEQRLTTAISVTATMPFSFARDCRRNDTLATRLSSVIRLAIACVFVAATAPWCIAQVTNVTNDQATPYPGMGHNYITGLNEIVNPANGSLSVRISVPVPPGRGFTLPFQFSYDSNGIIRINGATEIPSVSSNLDTNFAEQGGWRYGLPVLSASGVTLSNPEKPTQPNSCPGTTAYMFTDSAGTRHALGLGIFDFSECEQAGVITSGPFYAGGDNIYGASAPAQTGTTVNYPTIPFSIGDNDGTLYHFPGLIDSGTPCTTYCVIPDYIEDRNGNTIAFVSPPLSAHSAFPLTIKDTAGRSSVTIGSFGSTGGDAVNISGQSQPYTVVWGTTPYNFTIPFTYPAKQPSECSVPSNASSSGSLPVIKSIELPNGDVYQFGYDTVSGLLNKITYPTGAYVSYVWGLAQAPSDPVSYADQGGGGSGGTGAGTPNQCFGLYSAYAILQRTVYDGVQTAQSQTFTYSTAFPQTSSASSDILWTAKQTTVTTQDMLTAGTPSFNTVYSYSPFTVQPLPAITDTGSPLVANLIPLESTISYQGTNGSVLQTVSKTWDTSTPNRLTSATTTKNGLTSKVSYQYGNGMNIIEKDETDFGSGAPGALLRKTLTSYAPFTPAPLGSPNDRPCKVQVEDGNGNVLSEQDTEYDGGTSVCGSAGGVAVGSVSGLPANTHDEVYFGPSASTARGNATQVTHVNSSGSSPTTQYTYDETGQVISVLDPCGLSTCSDMTGSPRTTYVYTDSPAGGNAAGNSNAYLTQATLQNTGAAHVLNYKYNYASGQVSEADDENGQPTTYNYSDPLLRLTDMYGPPSSQNSNTKPDTHYNYVDGRSPSVTTTDPDGGTSVSLIDGLGRINHTQLTSDPSGTDYVDTTFDGLGRIHTVTNPYRSTNDTTYGTTTYSYDSLGRTLSEIEPANVTAGDSVLMWTYNGNTVFFQNEDQFEWQRTYDGLGRLTRVLEPGSTAKSSAPTLETDYQYSALDNLICVEQHGGVSGTGCSAAPSSDATSPWRVRRFVYNTLSQLTSASSPEAGAVSYTYDLNGNTETQTDARGVLASYVYDTRHRVINKAYTIPSNAAASIVASPPVSYVYDVIPKGAWTFPNQSFPALSGISQTELVGRLSSESNANGTILYGYDEAGRTILKSECTPSTCNTNSGQSDHYDLHFKYDLAGEATFSDLGLDALRNEATPNAGFYYGGLSMTYVSAGKTSGQLISATADIVDATHPADIVSGLQYTPLGGVSSSQFGNVYGEGNTYSPRGWLIKRYGMNIGSGSERTGTIAHDGAGNVLQLVDSLSGTTLYTPDQLNRLVGFSNSYSGATYGFDNWGNLTTRTNTTGNGFTYTLTYMVDNRISQIGSTDAYFGYDSSGNVQSDGINAYGYDAEGKTAKVSTSSTQYLYGPDGNRVAVTQGGSVTAEYLYNLDNTLITTLGTNGKLIRGALYGGGAHLADYTAGIGSGGGKTEFHLADEVNSLINTIDQTGTVVESCANSPFGEGLSCSPNVDYTETHFSDKKRDQESSLDYFGARYYASTTGRFMSPDPSGLFYANPINPQSLNLYSYGRNNPLTNIDPTGKDCIHINNDTGNYEGTDTGDCDNSTEALANTGHYVDGTVTSLSYNLSTGNYNFSYNPYDQSAESAMGSGIIAGAGEPITIPLSTDVLSFASVQTTPVGGLYHYGNYAGSGGMGIPRNNADAGALQHDYCYSQGGFSASSNFAGHNGALQACNQALCDTESSVAQSLADQGRTAGNGSIKAGLSPSDYAQHAAAADIVNYFSIVPFGNACKASQ